MFWSDKIAQEIIQSGKYKPYWVDDMFTPSGYAHIGSLRGPLVHDLIYRSLLHQKVDAVSTYVFNDFDPIDGLPPELSEKFSQYLGYPLRTAPSPEAGFDSFAHYFSSDFEKVLKTLGVGAKFLSSYDMYHQGKFNRVIKEVLDNSERIQDIYHQVSGSQKKGKDWLPLQVVCEKCRKLGTTRVYDWDGRKVKYICEEKMVTWAQGCGYEGEISPYDGNGKLPWKVDWPAHWKVLRVTIEGAGKDHSSAGGSRDIAKELCKEVFHINNPYNLPYEFFLIGGKKMSSSKGLGLKARDLTSLLPSEVGRFLFTRTDYRETIEFDPLETMAIPDLFDEYDRCWFAYIDGSNELLCRAFELSQISKLPPKEKTYLPRFRDVANYCQLANVDMNKKFSELKGNELNRLELNILKEREKYARIWLQHYASEDFKFSLTDSIPLTVADLIKEQRNFLSASAVLVNNLSHPEELQKSLYDKAKELNISTKNAFSAIYQATIGKPFGPKAGWLLTQYPKEIIVKRLKEAVNYQEVKYTGIKTKTIKKPDFFTIDKDVKKIYPSISIGIALIKDIKVVESLPELEKEKKDLLNFFAGLTIEILGTYPEIVSYRKLYKEMGIDWHSRRPSPEALLRRVVLGKELYTVNTCVDAYNLTVMKHKVSVGAFDAKNIKFPTVLRFAGQDDEIMLLGDDKPTKYTAKELAYYDKDGGYNIDFNYRDAQRTMVTEMTSDIWINVDGIFDITPESVARSLKESVELIQKYCGGKVEFEGVII